MDKATKLACFPKGDTPAYCYIEHGVHGTHVPSLIHSLRVSHREKWPKWNPRGEEEGVYKILNQTHAAKYTCHVFLVWLIGLVKNRVFRSYFPSICFWRCRNVMLPHFPKFSAWGALVNNLAKRLEREKGEQPSRNCSKKRAGWEGGNFLRQGKQMWALCS